MKLLIQHRHADHEISGVLTYVNSIIPELQLRGFEVRTISTQQDSVQKWAESVAWADIVHMNSNHLGFALLCKALAKKIVIKYHYPFYQSAHSHYEPMPLWQRLRTEFRFSLPKPDAPLKWKLHTAVKWARLATRAATALLSDRHAFCSEFLAESYGFPCPVYTTYNPIQIRHDQGPRSLSDLTHPYSFVFAGRLDHDKGVDVLLRAVRCLKDEARQFQVLILGDGPKASELRALAAQLGILDAVRFLGRRPNQEVIAAVRSALALIAPSRWQEPAPYVVLEASSVQTCAIVSKMGGLPEVAGPYGLFFANEDAQALAAVMAHCLDHPAEAIERGRQAGQFAAEQFSPAKAAAELIAICQELCDHQFDLSSPQMREQLAVRPGSRF